jgi:hypothetical protein
MSSLRPRRAASPASAPEEVRRAPFRRVSPPFMSAQGWIGQVDRAWENGWYAVLGRLVGTQIGTVVHLAVRNVPNTGIPWADKQWIKDSIAGPDRTGIEVFPPADRLIDGAEMYHLWVLPAGMQLPFGIHPLDGQGALVPPAPVPAEPPDAEAAA